MSKEELSYRALYQHALTLEKERLLLEESTSEEARRKTNEAFRNRAAAMETFHMQQLELLSQQLETERQERAFRERVQVAMGAKLEAEARAKQAAALRALKDQLDHNEAMDFSAAVVPLFAGSIFSDSHECCLSEAAQSRGEERSEGMQGSRVAASFCL